MFPLFHGAKHSSVFSWKIGESVHSASRTLQIVLVRKTEQLQVSLKFARLVNRSSSFSKYNAKHDARLRLRIWKWSTKLIEANQALMTNLSFLEGESGSNSNRGAQECFAPPLPTQGRAASSQFGPILGLEVGNHQIWWFCQKLIIVFKAYKVEHSLRMDLRASIVLSDNRMIILSSYGWWALFM